MDLHATRPKTTSRNILWGVGIFVLLCLIVLVEWCVGVRVYRALSPTGTTAFSSFGAGGSYDTSVGWGVGLNCPAWRGQAEWFLPKLSGKLNKIEVAIRGKDALSLTTFSVAQDNRGIPGTILETFERVPCPTRSGDPFPKLTMKSAVHPLLRAGVKYWVCAEPAEGTTGCSWLYSLNPANGFAFERSRWSWEFIASGPRSGAFSVKLTPVVGLQ